MKKVWAIVLLVGMSASSYGMEMVDFISFNHGLQKQKINQQEEMEQQKRSNKGLKPRVVAQEKLAAVYPESAQDTTGKDEEFEPISDTNQ